MDIQELRKLYKVDLSSPSGLVYASTRKRGSAKCGQPALSSINRNKKSGMQYYHGTYTPGTYGKVRRLHLLAHRVVFALHYGYWPETVDHKDGNSLNNHPDNLRPATVLQQQGNKGIRKNNSCGFLGVQFVPHKNYSRPWVAKCAGKHLGFFDTPEDASRAYAHAAKERYGEFYRVTE